MPVEYLFSITHALTSRAWQMRTGLSIPKFSCPRSGAYTRPLQSST